MRPTRILRSSIMPVAVFALLLGGAAQAADQADEPENPADEAPVEFLADEPVDLSTPEPENGWPTRTKPLAPKPSVSTWDGKAWDGKAGVDYRKPSIPGADFQPDQLAAGSIADQSTGVAWATITGGQLPLGWDKASIETRVDPSQEQGKVGTTLSRSVPVGDEVSVTLENGVSVTRTLPHVSAPGQGWASSQALRFNILPTDTSVSVGAAISSTEDKWLRSLSAEQKLFGGPVSVTGSVSETSSGDHSKSLRAGFKRTW
jgi:opacity protein-like surface antigen